MENVVWGGVFLFSLSMSLTSCEDILGEWSRPTPNPVTPGGGGSSTIAVTGVKLNEAYLRFDKNVLTAQTLTATVEPADATDKTLTWESSDETVATVDANGQVTPKAKGTVTITATANDGSGMKATSTVIVYDKIVDISSGAVTVTANEEWLINGDGTATAVTNGITIEDGATVTLNDINISKQIECKGTATIILADGSENKVTAPDYKAGIQIGGTGTTLTINAETAGTGILNVTGGDCGAGIGMRDCGDDNVTGGDITINGGVINATGGNNAAGIGTGYALDSSELYSTSNQCGDITINGGTVTATGGNNAAGIGTGHSQKQSLTVNQTCGDITIATGVTSVTAKRDGTGSSILIGMGTASGGGTQTCGKISFGTAEVFDGASPGTWSPSPMAAGNYGGLKLAISGSTWELTPAN